ncbi:MAG TPA: M20/M25/M40 family metallo-hydrolase [Capsulimonadaceae bacterium]|jgi:putative aminopeptidase FrvX
MVNSLSLPDEFADLRHLLALDSPSGDEDVIADWLASHIAESVPDARLIRLGDSLVATRSSAPSVAIFAHTDTTGFTVGYSQELIPIGSPAPIENDTFKSLLAGTVHTLISGPGDSWSIVGNPSEVSPGDRLVYSAHHSTDGDILTGPYLDNRCGVWAALQVLKREPDAAVAFTAGEEHSGGGATKCARFVCEELGVRAAIISDITWHTDSILCGKGPAISLRDRYVPSQRFLRHILAIAGASGIPFQREIESAGGSDGAYIERSGYPIDWVFVGAPEKRPHTSTEQINLTDLRNMARLIACLAHSIGDTSRTLPSA